MPGHYNKNKGPRIVGAGKGTTRSYLYYSTAVGDVMSLPNEAQKAATKFAHQQAIDKMIFNSMVIKPIIQSWEDRNVNNNGTKLNP